MCFSGKEKRKPLETKSGDMRLNFAFSACSADDNDSITTDFDMKVWHNLARLSKTQNNEILSFDCVVEACHG